MLAAVLRGKWALRAAAALQARLREKVGLSVESAGSATIPSQLMIMATAARGVDPDSRRLQGVIRKSPLAPGPPVCLPSCAVLPPIARLFPPVACRVSARCLPCFPHRLLSSAVTSVTVTITGASNDTDYLALFCFDGALAAGLPRVFGDGRCSRRAPRHQLVLSVQVQTRACARSRFACIWDVA